jgi:mRNA interferase MazF
MDLSQYQIILVNLDPTVGSEIRKTRPCVIISPDEMNRHLRTVIIAPVTSRSKNYPTRLKVRTGNKDGWVVIDQIRTIDKQRVVKVSGKLTVNEIKYLKDILKETFVDY